MFSSNGVFAWSFSQCVFFSSFSQPVVVVISASGKGQMKQNLKQWVSTVKETGTLFQRASLFIFISLQIIKFQIFLVSYRVQKHAKSKRQLEKILLISQLQPPAGRNDMAEEKSARVQRDQGKKYFSLRDLTEMT